MKQEINLVWGGYKTQTMHRPDQTRPAARAHSVTTPYPLNHTSVVLPLQYCHKMERVKPSVKDLSIAKPLARNISNDLSISQLLQYFKNPVESTYPPFQPVAGEVYFGRMKAAKVMRYKWTAV